MEIRTGYLFLQMQQDHVILFISGSMFLLLKGVSKDRAFEIGHEIVEAVTAANPKPVKLKFEKVCHYHICVLVSCRL